jgi:hypothetical protein
MAEASIINGTPDLGDTLLAELSYFTLPVSPILMPTFEASSVSLQRAIDGGDSHI